MSGVPSKIEALADKIQQADAIVIGGGSGLSSAAGYNHYHWSPALADALGAFREHYGFRSPFDGFYHCFSSYGEQWGYYSQYIRFLWEAPTGQTYLDLKTVVGEKPCFVLTTNIDMQFYRIFHEERICSYQGDFRYYQCSQPCHDAVYDSKKLVCDLSKHLIGRIRVPEELVPRCPHCGRVVVPWVRDNTFLEGTEWKTQVGRYHQFLRKWILDQHKRKVLLLELGVGEMTPSVIKLPFWEMTAKNDTVFYARLNQKASGEPEHLKGRSLSIAGDLTENLDLLRQLIQVR